jgi:transcriptional regulator of heat shock response
MRKHKLIELQKIIEEVEIATNVKLNPLYIADRKDEIEFLRLPATIINSILNRDVDRKQVQIGTTKMRLELVDTIEFENTLNKRIEELNFKLKGSNNLRESDILINEIDNRIYSGSFGRFEIR